jgi:hypothetical protein
MKNQRAGGRTKSNYAATILLLLLIASFPLSVYAYYLGPTSVFDGFEAAASLFFWFSLISLAFLFPLRSVVRQFLGYAKTVRGALIFAVYLSVHLFLYGLILEGILIYFYKVPEIIYQGSVSFTAILAYPESLVSILEDFAFNPSLNISIPPAYNLALSLYSIGIALVIAVLVVANVMKVAEMSKACTLAQRSRAIVALPALGVISGAACCISLPFLISLAVPTAAVLSNSIGAYYAAYLGFPLATAIALKYNMDSTMRIASKLGVPVAGLESKHS